MAYLRARGLEFESFDLGDLEVTDQIVTVPDNYPSKGSGELGAFFYDSEGNLLALGQATDGGQAEHERSATRVDRRKWDRWDRRM